MLNGIVGELGQPQCRFSTAVAQISGTSGFGFHCEKAMRKSPNLTERPMRGSWIARTWESERTVAGAVARNRGWSSTVNAHPLMPCFLEATKVRRFAQRWSMQIEKPPSNCSLLCFCGSVPVSLRIGSINTHAFVDILDQVKHTARQDAAYGESRREGK
jgi:hypothetical protein